MKAKTVTLHDKKFNLYIPHDKILVAVKKIANKINKSDRI